MNFSPNSPMRPLCAPLGCRKLLGASPKASPFTQSDAPELTSKPQAVLLIPFHCGWLKTLKASARNSNAIDSCTLKCLKSPMSKLTRPGPTRELRQEPQNVTPVGWEYAPGLSSRGP